MDVFEAIQKRHSYRGAFLSERIPRDVLQKIVQAGIQAPSGCNAQTTSFVIVDDPAIITRIATVLGKEDTRGAAAFIVCVMEQRPAFRGMSFGVEDCAAAVENILLAITALGYASVWLDGVLRLEDRAAAIASLLGIPAPLEVRIVLPVGSPAETRLQPERLPFSQRAWFNHYGHA